MEFSSARLESYYIGEIVSESVWTKSVYEYFQNTGDRSKSPFPRRAGGTDDRT